MVDLLKPVVSNAKLSYRLFRRVMFLRHTMNTGEGETVQYGWLAPNGDFEESGIAGEDSHQMSALAILARLEGVAEPEDDEFSESAWKAHLDSHWDDAQDTLGDRGYIRLDIEQIDGSNHPTRKQILWLMDAIVWNDNHGLKNSRLIAYLKGIHGYSQVEDGIDSLRFTRRKITRWNKAIDSDPDRLSERIALEDALAETRTNPREAMRRV